MLVICFGMGTTYRSVLSWGIPVTARRTGAERSRNFLRYFHEDGRAGDGLAKLAHRWSMTGAATLSAPAKSST